MDGWITIHFAIGLAWSKSTQPLSVLHFKRSTNPRFYLFSRCGFIGRVGAVRLPANGLRGTIPQEIGYLQALQTLDLSHNYHLHADNNLLNYVSKISNLSEWCLR